MSVSRDFYVIAGYDLTGWDTDKLRDWKWEEGEEYIIAARTFGKDKSNAIKKIRLKKREGAGSLIDEPDYKV